MLSAAVVIIVDQNNGESSCKICTLLIAVIIGNIAGIMRFNNFRYNYTYTRTYTQHVGVCVRTCTWTHNMDSRRVLPYISLKQPETGAPFRERVQTYMLDS